MKLFPLFITTLLLWSCTSTPESPHSLKKDLVSLKSSAGKTLLDSANQVRYQQTKKYWEAQRKNFCGVCSIAVSANTLYKDKKITQDNFFDKGVSKHIISAQAVAKMGLTLREIYAASLLLLPDMMSEKFYSHISGLDLFRQHLKELNTQQNSQIIINFSRQSLAGTGMRNGHFSPAVAYDEKTRQVLILEVQGSRDSFWVSDRDLYSAMQAIDPVSKIPRGWLKLQVKK